MSIYYECVCVCVCVDLLRDSSECCVVCYSYDGMTTVMMALCVHQLVIAESAAGVIIA